VPRCRRAAGTSAVVGSPGWRVPQARLCFGRPQLPLRLCFRVKGAASAVAVETAALPFDRPPGETAAYPNRQNEAGVRDEDWCSGKPAVPAAAAPAAPFTR
jgi:hypothetical protein